MFSVFDSYSMYIVSETVGLIMKLHLYIYTCTCDVYIIYLYIMGHNVCTFTFTCCHRIILEVILYSLRLTYYVDNIRLTFDTGP